MVDYYIQEEMTLRTIAGGAEVGKLEGAAVAAQRQAADERKGLYGEHLVTCTSTDHLKFE